MYSQTAGRPITPPIPPPDAPTPVLPFRRIVHLTVSRAVHQTPALPRRRPDIPPGPEEPLGPADPKGSKDSGPMDRNRQHIRAEINFHPLSMSINLDTKPTIPPYESPIFPIKNPYLRDGG